MYDNCGNCGHWTYLWICLENNNREGECNAHRIITGDQGWCKTHTAYTEEKE